ncbi:actin binding protein [Aspergillus sclerotiicarbonarius CBS 121057]|uniref:Actin binding protein n=1 Tax=Aspergillus sclerotiicarbonarius (strain CBS 121057 / IBT 28362) TaxID=1448318 RepID=A0A319ED67_ASPSB|nr:actin binding protein [Aspergillus sclerotiicarbonarius CBS 121057]
MATLNLSANGPSISKSYQNVINSSFPSAGTGSPTYGQWAIFSVSTPLVNAFQRDSGNKESVLKVQDTGAGELVDLIDEFSEGKIQFAYVKVVDPNTGLPKNVLIAWCGEGVPERTKGYFTSHLSAVSKFLHGYHVQITARSEGDLTAEGIIQKVGDASGAKYTPGTTQQPTLTPKPPVSTKPVFTPSRTAGIDLSAGATRPERLIQKDKGDNDGWGPDAPPVTRTELEKVQPAYIPTKVNIQKLKSESNVTANTGVDHAPEDRDGIVKGGYQPVGKVDIAAIRKQARESGNIRDDRPEPVRGAYEPVGKVDIAAIRSKAQNPGGSSVTNERGTNYTQEPVRHVTSPGNQERLMSLPKPKVSNKFGVNSAFAGTKPPLPSVPTSKPNPAAAQIGSASRTFADEGGKTPAQLWAERKARERGQDSISISSPSSNSDAIAQGQHSDKGDWKSSYNGKTWAPVQTTHTGKSFSSDAPQTNWASDPVPIESPQSDTQNSQNVSAIRDQFSQGFSSDSPPVQETVLDNGHTVPQAGLQDSETSHESVPHQPLPTPPQQPRSPTPPTPARETSPIRVAVPVGKGLTDVHDEQRSPPQVIPVESLQQAVPKDEDIEDDKHDIGRATAEATVSDQLQEKEIQAIVQYDYEKAEDNEIELREGEYVTNIEMVDQDWWLGSNAQGDRGLFPSNYVEVVANDQQTQDVSDDQDDKVETNSPVPITRVPESPVPAPTPAPVNESTATALYDYEAAEDNELSFPEGAEITNVVSHG